MLSFFLWRRPSARSTLCPYTTLFRSEDKTAVGSPLPDSEVGGVIEHLHQEVFPIDIDEGVLLPHLLPDRKSTRLNSSHRTTSYAVSCLKKNRRMCHVE